VGGGCSTAEHERGLRELEDFAVKTLMALVMVEERQLRFATGLRLFCRMDVGVLRTPDGLGYWVNEIDRTQNASLFACGVTDWALTLAKDFAQQVPEYVHPTI
jgi:hypothetical protein